MFGKRGCQYCGQQHDIETVELMHICSKYSYHDKDGWPTMPDSYRSEVIQDSRIENAWIAKTRNRICTAPKELPDTDWFTEYLHQQFA